MSNFLTLLHRLTLPDAKIASRYELGNPIAAYITKIYDGDTITVKFYQFNNMVYQESIRIEGIDTPEICVRDKMNKFSNLEELTGRYVRDYVRELAKNGNNNCYINIKSLDDKYGRPICQVYLDQQQYPINKCPKLEECLHLNQHLLDKGYAKPYNGGTKDPFTPSELLSIIGADNGFHTIDWDYRHRDFMLCAGEVVNHYKSISNNVYLNEMINKMRSLGLYYQDIL